MVLVVVNIYVQGGGKVNKLWKIVVNGKSQFVVIVIFEFES